MQTGETVAIGWIDGGSVRGSFAFGLLNTYAHANANNHPITQVFRYSSSVIHSNRERVLEMWEASDVDWLLWVDGDVVLTPQVYDTLVQSADQRSAPVVCGICFIMSPFTGTNEPRTNIFTDNLFQLCTNELVPINSAGMGVALMHRSILPKLRDKYGKKALFAITYTEDEEEIGEDVSFFLKVRSVGIPLYVNTSAIATHEKTVPLDLEAYVNSLRLGNPDPAAR